ncbi:OsmC family protein [bacterium]|nr:OsmC family protein [bacterium]
MKMTITFPGGAKVDAAWDGYVVHTDQPVAFGGEESAPSPMSLFLASLGACAGYYVQAFCRGRELSVEGIRVVQENVWDKDAKRFSDIRIRVETPHEFPEKYREPMIRAVSQCSVKKALADPPNIEVAVVTTE